MENLNELLHHLVSLAPWREESHRNAAHAVVDRDVPAPVPAPVAGEGDDLHE